VEIVTRAQWGFSGWSDGNIPDTCSRLGRKWIVLHYEGENHVTVTGPFVPQQVHQWHLDRGWFGIGYNYVVDQSGVIYEGRGLDAVGSHCTGHNTDGIGILIAVGGDQEPSAAALRSVSELIAWMRQLVNEDLAVVGHGDLMATDCPGEPIRDWIAAGMPLEDGDEMKLTDPIALGGYAQAEFDARHDPKDVMTVGQALQWAASGALKAERLIGILSNAAAIDYTALAEALAEAGVEVSADAVATAVLDAIRAELND
jgi:hypothetical protein